jgi:hypothetical protein
MVMMQPSLAVVHRAASGQVRQAAPNRVPACPPGGGPDRHGDAGRAGDRLAVQVDGEAVLGEVIFDRGRRLAA